MERRVPWPTCTARALPDAWIRATPTQITAARLALADRTLRHLLGEETLHSSALAEAASLARQVAVAASALGRPLFAAYTSLPWPQEPHLVLWHVACLVHANLDACEAHLLAVASGVTTQEVLQRSRRWTDQDWAAARTRLQQRGWLAAQGALTPTGAAAKRHLEEHTDTLAASALDVLSAAQQARLITLVQSLGRQLVHAGDTLW